MKTKALKIRVTQVELAALLGRSPVTIRSWTKARLLPQPIKVCGRQLYDLAAVKRMVIEKCLSVDLLGGDWPDGI